MHRVSALGSVDRASWEAAQAAPRVPLVLLPPDSAISETLAVPSSAALSPAHHSDALDATNRLCEVASAVAGRGATLDRVLDDAALTVGRLAAATSVPASPEAAGAVALSPVHYYFGVRTACLGPDQAAAQTLRILFRSLVDMRQALVDGNDLLAEVEAIAALLAHTRRHWPRHNSKSMGGGEADYAPSGDGLERWILAHHLYFLLNLHAAAQINGAAVAIAGAEDEVAAEHLTRAAVFVRGFTGAMAHSASLPAAFYRAVVRPTMRPPAVPAALSGHLQPEHASYRAAVNRLLDASPEPFDVLAGRDAALALARDDFLQADLVDIERHVQVAHTLVGNDRSLVQRENASDNAVGTLRAMRHARATRYCRLMRFGDHAFTAWQGHAT